MIIGFEVEIHLEKIDRSMRCSVSKSFETLGIQNFDCSRESGIADTM